LSNKTVSGGIGLFALAAAGALMSAADAADQSFPRKPVTYIVPYGAGSGNDVIARIHAKKVTENWGNNVIVVNRAGATGGIGLEVTAAAAPDGHTIVIASTSQIINQFVSKVRYDFARDFAPVTYGGSMPYSIAVLKSFPVNSIKELVALARKHPGKLNYTGTIGSIANFMGWMLQTEAKIDIFMVPNKLSSEAEADVMSGRIELWFGTASATIPHALNGRVKALAVTSQKRLSDLPNVPTIGEAGYPKVAIEANYYVMAPPGTPQPILDALNAEFVKAINDKEVRDRLKTIGVEPATSTPQEAAAMVKAEVGRWRQAVQDSGIRID
jgi:tripartite-type tricarboxylate transporter receptor subunit TctC